jgi:hypothetical protein
MMPNEPGTIDVTGGTLLQIDDSGTYAVWYVGVDIPASSSPVVTATLTPGDTEDPVVTVATPDGGDVWDIGLAYDITWTATDNIGVTSITIMYSSDGGATYPDTLCTGEANDGTYSWTVDAAATLTARIKVIAYDDGSNEGEDISDADFEVHDPTAGITTEPRIPSCPVITGTSPNPFRDRAVIRFGIPAEGKVEIALYDVAGRRVARLVDDRYPAGYHEVAWANPGTVGTGLYFLKLRFGRTEATHKVVVSR